MTRGVVPSPNPSQAVAPTQPLRRRRWEAEKFGNRFDLSTSGDTCTVHIRQMARLNGIFPGASFHLSPTQAVEVANVLTTWAEHQFALRRASAKRRRASLESTPGGGS